MTVELRFWSSSALVAAFLLVPGHVDAQPSGAPVPASPAVAPRPEPTVAELEARLEHEPSVDHVVARALRESGLLAIRPRREARRARLSGLIPQVRARARRGRERDARETDEGTNLSTDDDAVLEATLVLDLPRLVYSGEEPAWAREARALAAARARLIRLVIGLYFERRRLVLEQALTGPELELGLRVAAITAELDVLTGGYFGEAKRAGCQRAREARGRGGAEPLACPSAAAARR